MSRFRLFLLRQYMKIHIFSLALILIFVLFLNIRMGLFLWLAVLASSGSCLFYRLKKPWQRCMSVYRWMAILSLISLTIVSNRFLMIAFRVDLINMIYFGLAMFAFASLTILVSKYISRRRNKKSKMNWHKTTQIVGWALFLFIFFYQVILSYILRPNFLTVFALSLSHFNLLAIVATYFDLKQKNS